MMSIRKRLMGAFGAVALLNVSAWLGAIAVFHGTPVSLALMFVIYGLGLRHAVDADHIAAIDNVTRKLMEERQRPVAVGLFFALGHSAVVLIVTLLISHTAQMLNRFESLREIGGTISVSISTLFLFVIALMNFRVFLSVYRSYRQLRLGVGSAIVHEPGSHAAGGVLTRLCGPLFALVSQSWHMFPLGFLFGLGFDTATEVALLGISATQAGQGMSIWSILVFPALFAAGMSLVDTTDGVMMLGAYEWAFVKPLRKLYYNMSITLLSAVIAVVVGGIEVLGLIGHRLALRSFPWRAVNALNANFTYLGFAIVGMVLMAWVFSYSLDRLKRGDSAASQPG